MTTSIDSIDSYEITVHRGPKAYTGSSRKSLEEAMCQIQKSIAQDQVKTKLKEAQSKLAHWLTAVFETHGGDIVVTEATPLEDYSYYRVLIKGRSWLVCYNHDYGECRQLIDLTTWWESIEKACKIEAIPGPLYFHLDRGYHTILTYFSPRKGKKVELQADGFGDISNLYYHLIHEHEDMIQLVKHDIGEDEGCGVPEHIVFAYPYLGGRYNRALSPDQISINDHNTNANVGLATKLAEEEDDDPR